MGAFATHLRTLFQDVWIRKRFIYRKTHTVPNRIHSHWIFVQHIGLFYIDTQTGIKSYMIHSSIGKFQSESKAWFVWHIERPMMLGTFSESVYRMHRRYYSRRRRRRYYRHCRLPILLIRNSIERHHTCRECQSSKRKLSLPLGVVWMVYLHVLPLLLPLSMSEWVCVCLCILCSIICKRRHVAWMVARSLLNAIHTQYHSMLYIVPSSSYLKTVYVCTCQRNVFRASWNGNREKRFQE